MSEPALIPKRLDLKRDERLRIEWPDGTSSTLPVATLRRNCPCAMCKITRDGTDPHQLMRPATPDEADAVKPPKPPAKKRGLKLSVVPDKLVGRDTVAVTKAELMGNYAIKLHFDDGHSSGIYTWVHLRELADE
jgi:DUF971 family protein